MQRAGGWPAHGPLPAWAAITTRSSAHETATLAPSSLLLPPVAFSEAPSLVFLTPNMGLTSCTLACEGPVKAGWERSR